MVWIQIALIILLNIANGFFAASEIAVVSARRGRLQQRAEAGSQGARAALGLADEPNRFLATVQVGITLITIFAAAFGGDVLATPLATTLEPTLGPSLAEPFALALVVLLLTYVSLIVGELVPKRLALQHAERIATTVAPIMLLIARFAAPVVWFLTFSTQLILRLLGQHRHAEEQVTQEDVLSLVREGTEGGTVEQSERDFIERVFSFTDATTRSIMTPRTEVVALAIDVPLDQAVQQVMASGYSRIPVYQGTIDTVVGILYAKDLLGAMCQSHTNPRIADLMRPPVFVLEQQSLAVALQQFRHTHSHLAVVVDEYGQVDGLVTLEDVLEELTGDITDEYDAHAPMVVHRPDGSFLVDGLLSYSDAHQRIGLPGRDQLTNLPSFDTVAGFALAVLEHIPQTGEIVSWQDWQIEVIDMDGVRIDKLLFRQNDTAANAQSQGEAALAMAAMLPPPQVTMSSQESSE